MKTEDLSGAGIVELVDAYATSAVEHGLATRASDPRRANGAHSVLAAAYRELRARGLDAQRALLPLLDHEDTWVQGWAAAHALEFDPELGEVALNRLGSASDLCAFNSRTVLSEWRQGRLSFP